MRDPEPAALSFFTRVSAARQAGLSEQPMAVVRRLLARRGRRRRQSPRSFRPSASAPVPAATTNAVIGSAMRPSGPTRVLIVAADRRFRAVVSTLLTQRGCRVNVHESERDVREQAARDHVDVVVIDATGSLTGAAETAAGLQALRPRVGLVAVSSDPRDRLSALPVLAKWGSVDVLYLAIERARLRESRV